MLNVHLVHIEETYFDQNDELLVACSYDAICSEGKTALQVFIQDIVAGFTLNGCKFLAMSPIIGFNWLFLKISTLVLLDQI